MNTHRGKVIAILLFALVALGGCANVQQKWNMLKSRRAFKQANLAYSNKEYVSAIDLYNTTLDLDPNPDPRVLVTTYFYRGSSSHLLYRPSSNDPENDARLEAAIKDYEKAIELSQEHSDEFDMLKPYQQYGMEQLAAIYRDNLDDFESAEKYFKSLIEFDPKTPERYYALADVYERFHDPEELPLLEQAIESYKKPVDLAPSDPIAYRQVANLLNKYGRFDETMEWLGKARDVQATNPEGYYLIAVHYWDKVYRDPDLTVDQKKQYIDLGLVQLDQSLEIDDQYVDALIYKNLLLREQAKIEPSARRKAELTALADELRDRAIVLREQQQAAEKAAAAAASEGEEKQQQPPTQPPSSH